MPLPLLLSEPGPILTYLSKLQTSEKPELERTAASVIAATRAMLATPDGRMFMELLEKSLAMTPLPLGVDERALLGRNAQGFILADLRRIASNEIDLLAANGAGSARHANRKPRARRA